MFLIETVLRVLSKVAVCFWIISFISTMSGAEAAFGASSSSTKLIYGIPNSGWTSSQWNWGYASGTGHDCAAICRNRYKTSTSRQEFVQSLLLSGSSSDNDDDEPPDTSINFEEVKLVLALAWQRGRWDGSDGGSGGYGDVLNEMANAQRYESGSDKECSIRLVQDMQERYHLLKPSNKDLERMEGLLMKGDDDGLDYDRARRVASGLVLKSMGFIENGC